MRRDLMFYTLFLLMGLGLAYYTSLPRDEKAAEKVEWAKIDPKDVSEVTYSSEKRRVQITRVASPEGYWAKVENLDKGDTSAPVVEEFRVNKKFVETLAGFNPFLVLRDIGKVKDLKLDEFGLKQPEASFVISGKSGKLDLKIGKKAYGSRNLFVIDNKQDRVLLVGGQEFDDIEKARTRLMQKDVADLDFATVTSAKVSVGAASRVLDHTKRDGAGELIWSDKGDKGQAKPMYKNFMTQLEKTTVVRYANAEEAKAVEVLPAIGELVFSKDKAELAQIRFFKQPSTGGGINYWVHNSQFGSFALLMSGRGEALEKDLKGLVE